MSKISSSYINTHYFIHLNCENHYEGKIDNVRAKFLNVASYLTIQRLTFIKQYKSLSLKDWKESKFVFTFLCPLRALHKAYIFLISRLIIFFDTFTHAPIYSTVSLSNCLVVRPSVRLLIHFLFLTDAKLQRFKGGFIIILKFKLNIAVEVSKNVA